MDRGEPLAELSNGLAERGMRHAGRDRSRWRVRQGAAAFVMGATIRDACGHHRFVGGFAGPSAFTVTLRT